MFDEYFNGLDRRAEECNEFIAERKISFENIGDVRTAHRPR
jgi:hypothetical protein